MIYEYIVYELINIEQKVQLRASINNQNHYHFQNSNTNENPEVSDDK